MTDSTNLPAADAVTEATSDDLASQASMAAADAAGQTMASDRIQLAQAAVQVPQPNPGETVTITVAPGQTVQLGFDYVAAGNGEVLENGALVLPVNGGEVVLEGFAAAATAQPPVELTNSDGTVIELGDFLVAIDVPIDVLIDTAAGGGDPAGPLPDTTTANQGAGFSPGNGPQILGSLDPDGPVGPTALQYTVPERENFLDDLDEDGDTPPDDVPDAEDDGPNTTNEGFCLDEAGLDGGEGGNGYGYGDDIHDPTTGSAIKTSVTVDAGAVLTFKFNFLDGESPGQTSYIDFAVVVIGDQVFKLSDVLDANLPGVGTEYDEQSGYLTFTYTFPAGGTYDIGFAVFNEGDDDVDSALLIDDVSISDGSFADGFETDLGNWDTIGNANADGDVDGIAPAQGSQQALLDTDGGVDVEDVEDFFNLPHGVMQDVLNADISTTTLSDNVLDNDSFGTDGPGGIVGITYVGGIGEADAPVIEDGKTTITAADGSWVLEFYTSDANADGRDMGDYTFTLLGPIDHPAPGVDDLHGAFQYIIEDSDGDTDTATLSICIKDDVPTIDIYGAEGGIELDETVDGGDDPNVPGGLLASATVFIYDIYGTDEDFGADGPGDLTGALTIPSNGTDSGLVDTLSGEAVLLTLESGQVVGRTADGGDEVFRISFDNSTGDFTVTQSRALVHGDPFDDDEAGDPLRLAEGLVGFELTITDGDGDTDTDSIDLGSLISFEDDGPRWVEGAGGAAIVLDETDNDADDNDVGGLLATRTVSLASVLGATIDYGSDGPEDGSGLHAAIHLPNAETGLTDAVTGQAIVLVADGPFVAIGKLAISGEEAFRISFNPTTDEITVTQSRAVEHDDPLDHDEAGSPETIQPGSLILLVTATDGDGDSIDTQVDLGQLIKFEDDGPTAGITLKPGAELRLDESVGLGAGDPNANDEADSADPDDIGYATILGSDLFTSTASTGSDGPGGATIQYSFGLSEDAVDTGLIDAETGEHIFLFNSSGGFVAVHGTDVIDASLSGATNTVFTLELNPDTGDVTVHQYRAVQHDNAGDPDESTSPEIMDAGKLLLIQTVTDADGDKATSTIDLGSIIKFEDDGPTLELGGAEGAITVDESVGPGGLADPNAADETIPLAPLNAIGFSQFYFADLYPNALVQPGSDGSGGTTGVLTLAGADSGLVDTESHENIVLVQIDEFTIVGRTELGLEPVFEITLDGDSGLITVTQYRAMVHGDTSSHDEFQSMVAGLIGVDVTLTDGDGDATTASADIGSLIRFEDDGPTVTTAGPDTTTVDEDDLPDGNDATPDSLTVSGSIGVDFGSDGAGDVSGITGPAGLTSDSFPITYSFDPVTNTMTASANGAPVFTVTIDPTTGQYSFTLSGPIDHATGSDNEAIEIGFTVTDGDGDPVSSSFTVNVTDDKAEAEDDTATVNDGLDSVNVTIMFDRSGSMDEDPGVDGFSTRIDLARAAIASLLQAYDSVADVNILIVDFAGAPSTGGEAGNSGWLTGPDALQAAIAYMAGLDPDGNTDYSKAVEEAMSAYGNGTPVADESVVYFLSDGNPTVGGVAGTHELTAGLIDAWESFLVDNHIDTAFAVGIGNGVNGVTNINALEGIAFPNDAGDQNPVIVTDAGLIDALLITVSGSASGNVLDNDEFGADGRDAPAITRVTFGPTDEYVFDGTAITKNGNPYSSGLGATIVVIVTAFGTLTFDFATGAYDYAASAAGSDTFHYTIVDGDGDQSTGSLVLNVGASGVVQPDLVTGTDGNDNLSSNNDAIPDIMGGGDGNDRLEGGDGSNDLLIGGAGSDALFGNGGDDVLIGGSQSEVKMSQPADIRAADGADYLDGGDGHDILFGNEGDDILIVRSTDEAHGGSGNDLFVLHDNVNFGLVDGGGTLVDANRNEIDGPVSLAGTFKGDRLTFDGALDLTLIDNENITGIETISMVDDFMNAGIGNSSHSVAGVINHFAAGADTLTLDASDVIDLGSGVFDPIGSFDGFGDLSNQAAIKVDGDADDTLNLTGTGTWTQVTSGVSNIPAGYDLYVHDSGGAADAENAYVLVQATMTVTGAS